jgi:hypothetical protein
MNNIIIETSKPEIADKLKETFGVDYDKGTLIIASGGKIHTKFGVVSTDLLIHEMTHLDQQKNFGKENSWWGRYLVDPEFRIEMETKAYQNQFNFLKTVVKDRNELYRRRVDIVRQLSGEMYGSAITSDKALELIK